MAEEHAVTFSAGLAADGLMPLTTIYSTFLQRAFDQIIHDVAVQDLKIVLCLDRAGLVGEDGAPQHGVFDVGYLRMIPGMVVMQPRERRGAARHAVDRRALARARPDRGALPARRRSPRSALPEREPRAARDRHVRAAARRRRRRDPRARHHGAAGARGGRAARGRGRLGHGRERALRRARSTSASIAGLARSVGRIVTVEENVADGRLRQRGERVPRPATACRRTPLLRIALPDEFVPHGKRDELLQQVGLDAAGIARRTLEWVRATQRQFT